MGFLERGAASLRERNSRGHTNNNDVKHIAHGGTSLRDDKHTTTELLREMRVVISMTSIVAQNGFSMWAIYPRGDGANPTATVRAVP